LFCAAFTFAICVRFAVVTFTLIFVYIDRPLRLYVRLHVQFTRFAHTHCDQFTLYCTHFCYCILDFTIRTSSFASAHLGSRTRFALLDYILLHLRTRSRLRRIVLHFGLRHLVCTPVFNLGIPNLVSLVVRLHVRLHLICTFAKPHLDGLHVHVSLDTFFFFFTSCSSVHAYTSVVYVRVPFLAFGLALHLVTRTRLHTARVTFVAHICHGCCCILHFCGLGSVQFHHAVHTVRLRLRHVHVCTHGSRTCCGCIWITFTFASV